MSDVAKPSVRVRASFGVMVLRVRVRTRVRVRVRIRVRTACQSLGPRALTPTWPPRAVVLGLGVRDRGLGLGLGLGLGRHGRALLRRVVEKVLSELVGVGVGLADRLLLGPYLVRVSGKG